MAVIATEGGAWITVFAFVATGAVANYGSMNRDAFLVGLASRGAAAVPSLAPDSWARSHPRLGAGRPLVRVAAFIVSTLQFGVFGVRFPTRIEWDFRSDDHSAPVR